MIVMSAFDPACVKTAFDDMILQRFGRRIRWRALSLAITASQSTLFPERLDDYLDEDNSVRAIDVFVDELDLAGLSFGGVEPEATGRPAYHPATLLKIYVYGYLNRVQSSRRLERECQRNIRPADAGLQDHMKRDLDGVGSSRWKQLQSLDTRRANRCQTFGVWFLHVLQAFVLRGWDERALRRRLPQFFSCLAPFQDRQSKDRNAG